MSFPSDEEKLFDFFFGKKAALIHPRTFALHHIPALTAGHVGDPEWKNPALNGTNRIDAAALFVKDAAAV